MSNLFLIAFAKTLLLAGIIFWLPPVRTGLFNKLAIAYGVGSIFGLAFFALFYILVPAIAYHHELTFAFVTANVVLSYGATAATVMLLPFDLKPRNRELPLTLERAYFATTIVLGFGAFTFTQSEFVRAFSTGVILMSLAEIAALVRLLRGPVSRMLRGEFKPLGIILAASAGLGVLYECLNLAFPVWEWVTLAGLPAGADIAIMMSVGYIVLIHPLFVVTKLLVTHPDQCFS